MLGADRTVDTPRVYPPSQPHHPDVSEVLLPLEHISHCWSMALHTIQEAKVSAASSTLEQRLVLTCKADISCCNMRHCILASFSAHDSEVLCCCVSQGVLSSNDVRCTKCRRNLFTPAKNGQEWTILSHSSQSIPSCSAPVNRAWQSGAAVGGSARAMGVATLLEVGVRRLLRCAAALQAPRDPPFLSYTRCELVPDVAQ